MRNVAHGLVFFLVLTVCCRADLTLRYTVDVKAGGVPASLPSAMEVRIKGDKTLTKLGPLTKIVGNDSSVTLINPATKQYAQTSVAEYAGFRAALALTAAALKNLNFDVESRNTGQSEVIAGIRAEERIMKLSVSANLPGAAASPVIRVDLHTWVASPDDMKGVPMLRQYAASAQRAMNASAAGDAVEKLFQQLPGAAEKLRAVTEAATLDPDSLALKVQEAVYNLKNNPNVPIVAMTMALAEISTSPIEDSVFEVPPDFQLVSAAELTKALTPAPTPTGASLAPGEQISKVGSEVSAPSIIYKRNPAYSSEALKAKLEGAVTLSIVVDKEGVAKNIRVVRSLGLGLDEKAIEAVSQWKFRPGQKDGQPVNVMANVVVNFKLLDRPPQQ